MSDLVCLCVCLSKNPWATLHTTTSVGSRVIFGTKKHNGIKGQYIVQNKGTKQKSNIILGLRIREKL
jgi:hypothetical protein